MGIKMGDKINPIVGKSPVHEEQRKRQEQIRRQQRKAAMEKRRKQQKRKAAAMLTLFGCIIIVGIGMIINLVSDIKGGSESGTENNNTADIGDDIQANEKPVSKYPYLVSQADVKAVILGEADYKYDCDDDDIMKRLRSKSEKNSVVKYIYENYRAYPEDLLKAVAYNSELVDFAVKYPLEVKKNHAEVNDMSQMYKKGEMPLFIQWDDRWGYYRYGNDVIGTTGCGPTCLSMILTALTGRDDYSPTKVSDFAMDKGYYYNGQGTAWALFSEGANEYGLTSRTIGKNQDEITAALDHGEYLVFSMGPGIFTTGGHYIVIYDYDRETGELMIKDPNSVIRSNTKYSLDDIKNQIKNIWAIGK